MQRRNKYNSSMITKTKIITSFESQGKSCFFSHVMNVECVLARVDIDKRLAWQFVLSLGSIQTHGSSLVHVSKAKAKFRGWCSWSLRGFLWLLLCFLLLSMFTNFPQFVVCMDRDAIGFTWLKSVKVWVSSYSYPPWPHQPVWSVWAAWASYTLTWPSSSSSWAPSLNASLSAPCSPWGHTQEHVRIMVAWMERCTVANAFG